MALGSWAVMAMLTLGACGRVAPGTTGIDRGFATYNVNGTPGSSSTPGADTTSHCAATTTYSTDSKGNRTVVATGAGCPR